MWGSIPTLVSAGAVGVAIAMLFLSHKQYAHLLSLLKTDRDASTNTVKILVGDLKDYRRNALVAVVLSIIVQLAEPVIDRMVPRNDVKYPFTLSISPTDGLPPNVLPTVRHAGVVMKPRIAGEFGGEIDSKTNFGVEIFALQRHVDALTRVATTAQPGGNGASGCGGVGFDAP